MRPVFYLMVIQVLVLQLVHGQEVITGVLLYMNFKSKFM
jgi:hypothetical protein